ncbi:MAG: alanyl-tRNA editing protein [Deltaproteobacteria bacterium]|nr:alanyl-tRNA editing protein [Deltaproteobacteria bacterium]MBN2687373.1 alanyl-tRNA editing protein [Deltaproteobacteria bacterium]
MAVEKVFWNNPYQTELIAQVTSVTDSVVTLDKTIFYAFAGGQESDRGSIHGFTVLKAEKKDMEIFYILESGHDLKAGDEVIVEIQWPRRYRLMRLHFAAEIILEMVNQRFNKPEKVGAHIAEDKARLDFTWEGSISRIFPLLEEKAREIIDADLPIESAFSDVATEQRYWKIDGFARVPCGGTHLRKTGEIGLIRLKRNNIGKGRERIEIFVD